MSMNDRGVMAEISNRNIFSNHADSQDVKKQLFNIFYAVHISVAQIVEKNATHLFVQRCYRLNEFGSKCHELLSTEVHTTEQKKPIRISKAILDRLTNKTKINL